MIANNQKDPAHMVAHLETAKVLDPERSYPYQALAEHYEKTGKLDLALSIAEESPMPAAMPSIAAKARPGCLMRRRRIMRLG